MLIKFIMEFLAPQLNNEFTFNQVVTELPASKAILIQSKGEIDSLQHDEA